MHARYLVTAQCENLKVPESLNDTKQSSFLGIPVVNKSDENKISV